MLLPTSAAMVAALVSLTRDTKRARSRFTGDTPKGLPTRPMGGEMVDLLSTVSHEIRTPLTSIRGALGMVTSGALGEVPPEVLSLLHVADSSSSRLLTLVNDLLDYQKLQAGEVVFRRAATDLALLVGEAVTLMSPTVAAKRVTVETLVDDGALMLDHDRCIQVLLNLLSNAVRHSPVDGLVRVTAGPRAGNLVLAVEDEGPGVPPEERERIFEPFAQLRRALPGEVSSGLGLTIARRIAREHGGTLRADRGELGGAAFILTMPWVEVRGAGAIAS